MNTWDKCKNCGGEYGLHHYETNQCPVGGREAAIGRRQEWKSTTFENIEPDLAYQAARDTIAAQAARIVELEAMLHRICANPAVQDLIEKNPLTNYLIRDARKLLDLTVTK